MAKLHRQTVTAVFKVVNHNPEIDGIADHYLRQKRLDATPFERTVIAGIFRGACLDTLQRGQGNEADMQLVRAATIEGALRVLGVGSVPDDGFVLDRMTPDDLAAIDPHFRSLVRGLQGDLDSIRPVTALMQMVIDLRAHAAMLKSLRGDRAFFFYLGRRLEAAQKPMPLKAHALGVYGVLIAAVKEAAPEMAGGFPAYPKRDFEKARASMKEGAKAATMSKAAMS